MTIQSLHHSTSRGSKNSSRHNHNNRHSNHNDWSWSHVQQRLRRNRIVGPVAVCLFLLVGMPCFLNEDAQNVDARGMILQYLPLVEAVPFFRPRNAKRKAKISGTPNPVENNDSNSALGSSMAAVAEVETAEADVEVKRPQLSRKAGKRKLEDISSSSSSDYNFPLLKDPLHFQANADAPIPFRYWEAYNQNADVARKATLKTLEWRNTEAIDTILSRPNPNYDIAKRILPHYFIGNSAQTGHVVFVQRPGLSDLDLATHNDVTLEDMLHQYAFVFEYCWNILHANQEDDPNAIMISIIDLQGLDLSILRKRNLQNFVKEFVGMIDAHYPTRALKTYMINAPKWFSGLYKVVSPIMRESTKEKIVLFSAGADQDKALQDGLGKDMATLVNEALRVPTKAEQKAKAKNDLSLTSDILLDTDMEQEIRNFVRISKFGVFYVVVGEKLSSHVCYIFQVLKRLEQEGLRMKPTIPLP